MEDPSTPTCHWYFLPRVGVCKEEDIHDGTSPTFPLPLSLTFFGRCVVRTRAWRVTVMTYDWMSGSKSLRSLRCIRCLLWSISPLMAVAQYLFSPYLLCLFTFSISLSLSLSFSLSPSPSSPLSLSPLPLLSDNA